MPSEKVKQNLNTSKGSKNTVRNSFKIFNWKYITLALFIILPFVGFYLGLVYQKNTTQKDIDLLSKNPTKDVNLSSKDTSTGECVYGPVVPDMYLDRYTVKRGDTLLSIANNELGSTARINEIINLNKRRLKYWSLNRSSVIEEGWELYTSSKYLPPNSGELVAKMGKLTIDKQSPFKGRTMVITDPDVFPTGNTTSFNDNTVFFGKKMFEEGDCVIIIRDEGTDEDIVMGLQSELDLFRRPIITFGFKDVQFPKEQSRCHYESFGPEEVMRKYIVNKGDSLNSIARDQLGDASRVKEIQEANINRYISLKNSNFIEIDWELLLPPKWAVPSTGYLTGFAGTLIREESDEFRVGKDFSDPAQFSFQKASAVKYFGKDSFERGDCVVILDNRGDALGISSQDVDYIQFFKYGGIITGYEP